MVTLSDSTQSTHQSQSQQPTSSLLKRHIRSVISDVSSANTEKVAAELVSWIGPDREPDPSLLEFVADTILEDVTEQLNRQPSALARLSYRLTVALPAYGGILQYRLQSQFLESAQFLANHRTAEQGSWPELVALVGFVGELCTAKVVLPTALLDIYVHHLSRQLNRSELELEAVCVLLKAAGSRLWNDPHTSEVLTREMQALQDIHDQSNVSPLLSKKLAEVLFLHLEGWMDDTDFSLPTSPTLTEGPGDTPFVNPDIPPPDKCSIIPKHPEFYLASGDIVFVCRTLLFRVHSDHLCRSSAVFTDMIGKSKLRNTHKTDGCQCIHVYEEPEDFAILLQVLYNPGFPARHQTPDFATFSSILRTTTSYKIDNVREQILEDLRGAYPTTFQAYEESGTLGERVFGNPKPHPNAVLKLFETCNVAFALPFAYYRACTAGTLALTSVEPALRLPPRILAAAVVGQSRLKARELQVVRRLLFERPAKKFSCSGWLCPGSHETNHKRSGQTSPYERLFNSVSSQSSEVDMAVSVLETKALADNAFCTRCLERFNACLRGTREEIWTSLPRMFGLNPWSNLS